MGRSPPGEFPAPFVTPPRIRVVAHLTTPPLLPDRAAGSPGTERCPDRASSPSRPFCCSALCCALQPPLLASFAGRGFTVHATYARAVGGLVRTAPVVTVVPAAAAAALAVPTLWAVYTGRRPSCEVEEWSRSQMFSGHYIRRLEWSVMKGSEGRGVSGNETYETAPLFHRSYVAFADSVSFIAINHVVNM